MDEAASCCNMENKKLIEYSELSRRIEEGARQRDRDAAVCKR